MHAFSADPYALWTVAVISEYGHSSGADPVFSAVMLTVLLLKTFLEHLLYPLILKPHVMKSDFLIIISRRILGIIQPVKELLWYVVKKIYILEKLKEGSVKFIKVSLTFHKHRPAQIIKISKA